MSSTTAAAPPAGVTGFRDFVRKDGSTDFTPEAGRYHLYIAYTCPWAHRPFAIRKLKGLEQAIGLTVVGWKMGEDGWEFSDYKEPLFGFTKLKELYLHACPNYTGRYTVPCLYDKKLNRMVNNESPEILRMLNSEFNEFCATPEQAALDFYPASLQKEIDDVNSWVNEHINNGVYKAGFAKEQGAYDKAVADLFNALDRAEEILSRQRYLCGSQLTEADLRMFPTLIRFDVAYVMLFRCNLRRIADYPNVYNYMKEMYQDILKDTVNFEHIKKGYFLGKLSPVQLVPAGPDLSDLETPHNRK